MPYTKKQTRMLYAAAKGKLKMQNGPTPKEAMRMLAEKHGVKRKG